MTIYKCRLTDACAKSKPVAYVCCCHCTDIDCKKRCSNDPEKCRQSVRVKEERK